MISLYSCQLRNVQKVDEYLRGKGYKKDQVAISRNDTKKNHSHYGSL